MKLNFKIYSPFFILLFLSLLFSCTDKNKTPVVKTQQQKTTYNYEIYKIQPYLNKAENYYTHKVYDSAFKYYTKTREVYITEKDSARAGYVSLKMAEIQRISGDYNGSQTTAVEALKYLKKSNRVDLIGVYNILGMSYRKLLDFDSAIITYEKAAKITKDSLPLYILQNNIASAYINKGDYNTALKILKKLEKSPIVNKHISTKALVINNIGSAYFKMNNPQALNYLKEALHIRETIDDPKDLLSSYLKLSEFYIAKNRSIAKEYAAKVYNLASKIDNNEEKLNALKVLTLTAPENVKANYFKEYINLNDSITIVKSKSKNEFAKFIYDSKTLQAKNLELINSAAKTKLETQKNKLQVEKDKVLKIILYMIVVCMVIFSILVFYIQKLKHKKAKIIEVYNTESRISKKIHDELANDMFDTMMFTETLFFDALDKKEILLKRLDEVYEKTRDISRENNSIDTGSDFYIILIEMLARYKTASINVLPANAEAVTWDVLDDHKKITLYRVLQEFMVNMKKHSKATLVVVKFIVDDKKLYVNYVDNGIGIKKNNFFYKNGLQNAENRIKLINGTLTFDEVTKGLKISIAIPL